MTLADFEFTQSASVTVWRYMAAEDRLSHCTLWDAD